MVKVKVCGITRLSDAEAALALGADFIGFNFWPGTRRFIAPENAARIIRGLKSKAGLVGVFVNQPLPEVKEIIKRLKLDYAQLHGDEPWDYCREIPVPVIKALRLGSEQDLEAMAAYEKVLWLIDSRTKGFGGSGQSPDWALAGKAGKLAGKIILAGGLNAENVAQAIKAVKPWAVDAASGVESSPGVKDQAKLRNFFQAVKNAAR